MKISKEITITILFSNKDLEIFKNLLENILAANVSVNQGLGFLKTDEEKYIEWLLESISTEQ